MAYLTRKLLIPKPSGDDPATGYPTMDHEMVQRAPIIKEANIGDDDLEEAGANKRYNYANIDNGTLFQYSWICDGR